MRNIRFFESGAVDIDLSAVDSNAVAGKTDDALDEDASRVAFMPESDDLIAMRNTDSICKRVDQNVLAGADIGLHRKTGDLRKADEEGGDEDGEQRQLQGQVRYRSPSQEADHALRVRSGG